MNGIDADDAETLQRELDEIAALLEEKKRKTQAIQDLQQCKQIG
jgi:hypothetical protein